MKKRIVVSAVFSAGLAIVSLCSNVLAYDASTVIGQYDGSGNPDFDTNLSLNDGLDGTTSFLFPRGVDLDELNHRLFVADTENNRVLVFNLDINNLLVDREADFVLGQPDFKDSTQRIGADGLRLPYDLTYDDTTDKLYVADTGNTRILVFDTATITNGEDAVNVLGQVDFDTQTVAASQAGFLSVEGLTIDTANQRLFASDTWGARILVFDVTAITDGENAANVLGQANFTATGIATSSTGMRRPEGLVFDNTNNRLYAVDRTNNRVLVYDTVAISNGEAAVNVLGQTLFTAFSSGTTNAKFNNPNGVTLDESGSRLFVADSSNGRVMVFDVAAITNGESAVNVLGKPDFVSASDLTPSISNITHSFGLVYDEGNDLLYASDVFNANRIGVFDVAAISDGESMTTILGHEDGLGGVDFDAGNKNAGNMGTGFTYNEGIALDTVNHRLFVADQYNSRVVVFELDSDNELLDNEADFVFGQDNLEESELPDFTNATASDINQPTGLTYDESKNLLYVADRSFNRVLVFDTSTISNNEAAIRVLGQPDFTTITEDLSDVGLYYPQGISLDEDGQRLFVADEYNTRVVVFDVNSITNGEAAINVLGQTDFNSAVADITINNFNFPLDVSYYEDTDMLFVADSYNNRVLGFDMTTIVDGEDAVLVLGQEDFVSSAPDVTADGMDFPAGLGVDNLRKWLYVSDGNNRLLMFDLETVTDGGDAFAVVGQPDFVTEGFDGPAIDTLNLGDYLNFDGALFYEHIKPVAVNEETGRILVSESFSHRISAFDFVEMTTSSLADGEVNSAYVANFATSGDQGVVEYELVSGTLPAGVTLDASTGLTGTPTEDGTFNISVRATDDLGTAGAVASTVVNLSLTIDPEPVTPPPSGGGSVISSGGGGGGSRPTTNNPPTSPTDEPSEEPEVVLPEYYAATRYLVKSGFVVGYDDGYAHPERAINRAELMKLISLVAGMKVSDYDSGDGCFPDVKGEEWYVDYICYAFDKGLVSGYTDGYFHPERAVTRAEALKMVLGVTGLATSIPNSISSDWYAPYVEIARGYSLIDDSEGFDFDAASAIIRGEAFEFIYRALIAKEEGDYSSNMETLFLEDKVLSDEVELELDFEIVR